ncbi:phosphotransferase enzyme family protein [Falsibacillus albus]|uniref:Aminoglycoside phosphotransferase domain-containing protein n=1 Tax=Falsibacillus albus TaxID=2478915 RepID=A0A3L7K2Y4_9BACI|nr:phosphotransferase [Falsibacillus albus]RLQ97358.1 hypothetical protein D9X91_04195 [Falsibacillus albus]
MNKVHNLDWLGSCWDIGSVVHLIRYKDHVSFFTTDRGSHYLLKEKGCFHHAELEGGFLSYLYQEGLSVQVPIYNKYGKQVFRYEGGVYCIYPYTAGKPYSFIEEGAMEYINQSGRLISEFHYLAENYTECINYNEMELGDQIYEVLTWIHRFSLCNQEKSKLFNRMMRLDAMEGKLPKQLIHRDLHPNNMIFNKGRFKGFIDFDMCQIGCKVYDIAYFMVAVLKRRILDHSHDDHFDEAFHNFLCNYESLVPLSVLEKELLPDVMLFIACCYVIYFSLQLYYESTAESYIKVIKYLLSTTE